MNSNGWTEPENLNLANVSETSWKLAFLAAQIAAGTPRKRPPTDESYLDALRTAKSLVDWADGRRGSLRAADLFEAGKTYSRNAAGDVFKRLGWPDLQSPTSVSKLLKQIQEEATQKLQSLEQPVKWEFSGLTAAERAQRAWEESIKKLKQLADCAGASGSVEIRSLFEACHEHELCSEKLIIPRSRLDPKMISVTELHEHYEALLDLRAPWFVRRVTRDPDVLRIELAHRMICPECKGPCTEKGSNKIPEFKIQIGRCSAQISTEIMRLTCATHGEISHSPPEWS